MTASVYTMTTAEALASQFTENTGRHIMDSGGAYGRNWERNQGKTADTWMTAPSATIHDQGTEYAYVTINTFRWLESRLDFDPDMQARFDEFSAGSTAPWLVDMRDFAESVHDGTGYDEINVVNTYNYDSLLDEVLQWVEFSYEDERFVLLQYHGGCDVRGGYTAPKVYRLYEHSEYALFDEVVEFYCSENPEHSLSLNGTEWITWEGSFEVDPWDGTEHKMGTCPTCGSKQEIDARLDY